MSLATATIEHRRAIARPLKVLVPIITEELQAGDTAGLDHYRRAGELLLEARDQVAPYKWSAWLSKNFTLSKTTAWRYMKLAERGRFGAETIEDALGEEKRDARRHRGKHKPIGDFVAGVDAERLGQDRKSEREEIKLHRELALELIDIGFKALATRLHPDRGGSRDAMRRLNRVREELKAVAGKRTFV